MKRTFLIIGLITTLAACTKESSGYISPKAPKQPDLKGRLALGAVATSVPIKFKAPK